MTENRETAARPAVSAALRTGLEAFIRRNFGPAARLVDLEPMLGGHAGLTFGFGVAGIDKPGRYIIKLAPPGVRREGNTDVFRTAPLLRTLHGQGLPVPDVPFAAPDEAEFGVPYVVMERLPGREFFIWEPHQSFDRTPAATAPLWRQTAAVLPRIHRVDWRKRLPEWETPRPLAVEIGRWEPIYRKALEPAWIDQADRLRLRLLETLPDEPQLGVVHGDYQPGNCLFDAGSLTGVIDWELVRIGAIQLDIGWLMFCADHDFWTDEIRPVAPVAPGELADIWQEGMERSFAGLRWYQALAAYQLGAIACLNVRLHRKGQRIDPMWERFAFTVTRFFEQGLRLVS